MKGSQWLIALALGLGLTLALFGLLVGWPLTVWADPGTLYVALDGDDSKLCDSIADRCRTVQRAVDLAADGDTIKVAAGVYTDPDTPMLGYVVAVDKTITLRGGYDASFADPPDPATHPTTLDAQRQGRVISITGDIGPTIEGFLITGGDATGLGGILPSGQDAGGGIYCDDAHPIIANNIIIDNVASSNDGVSGGGIYLGGCDRAVVRGNTIVSNTASSGGYGRGGGICLKYSDATVHSNTIVSNTASTGGAGYGGGLHLYQSNATISDNTVEGNVGATSVRGQGGGIWIQYGVVTIRGNIVRGNVAQTPDKGTGGGLYALYAYGVTLEDNFLIGNAAYNGSGVAISQGSTFTLTNNIISRNQTGSSWRANGGGLWVSARSSYPSAGTLLHNTIADNVGGSGEGLYVRNYVTLDLINNIIAGHTIGITNTTPASSTVTADHTLFNGNDTDYGSGVTSTNDVHGDPAFVNPAAGDYHLLASSAAIDRGVDAGVTDDIDGDPRPLVAGYDIGADEWDPSKPTPTPTSTATNTPTPTSTPTSTPTWTPTAMPSATPTSTPTAAEWHLYLPLVLKSYGS